MIGLLHRYVQRIKARRAARAAQSAQAAFDQWRSKDTHLQQEVSTHLAEYTRHLRAEAEAKAVRETKRIAAKREVALAALAEAKRAGDTRRVHWAQRRAEKATTAALRAEVGR